MAMVDPAFAPAWERIESMTHQIAITGATGFIGRHLLDHLSQQPGVKVRALAFSTPEDRLPRLDNVTWIRGDLSDPVAAGNLCVAGSTLIHLAYPENWPLQAHLDSTILLAETATERGVRRVVHCSTAVIAGSTPGQRITESTPVLPATEYEKTKFRLETEWLQRASGRFDLAIARPTAVFGPGSKNLLSLANALTRGNPLVNYLKSSVYGKRQMNLVCVENVVSALGFLALREAACENNVFLITEDDDPFNNFRDVERILKREFGVNDSVVPPLPLPPALLSLLLYLSGKSCTNPERIYEGSRLQGMGWRKVSRIEEGLRAFAAWYLNNQASRDTQ